MVDRQLTTNKSKAVIVDLDGTLIEGNTLHIYIAEGLLFCIKHGHIIDTIRICVLAALRLLKIITHRTLKFKSIAILKKYPEVTDRLASKALQRINHDVVVHIDRLCTKGYKVLVATAAADYHVAKITHFDFVATKTDDNPEHIECRGEEKLARINEWLVANNAVMGTVITDHIDDLPLVEANLAGENILVNPDRTTLRLFRELKPAHLFLIDQVLDR